jgi:hypothetical protein
MTDVGCCAIVLGQSRYPACDDPRHVLCVVAGALVEGDLVEVVHRSGAVSPAVVRGVPQGGISSQDDDHPVRLEGLTGDAVSPGDTVRARGEAVPTLDLSGPAAAPRARLLAAAEKIVASGCSSGPAGMLAGLPPAVAVLLIEKRLRMAFTRQASSRDALTALLDAASLLEAAGLTEDGDRLRLVASAALEERELGPTMRDMAGVATMLAAVHAQGADAATERAGFASALLDFDGEAFAFGFTAVDRSGTRASGESLRAQLLGEGRAVAVGWCRRCRDAVTLDTGLRCPVCGRGCTTIDFVVPSEADAALAALRTRRA